MLLTRVINKETKTWATEVMDATAVKGESWDFMANNVVRLG